MKQLLAVALLALALAACSVHRERNVSSTVDVTFDENLRLRDHDFGSLFSGLTGRNVVYAQTYLGNFTLLYSPTVTDEDYVLVPHVHCYDASLDRLASDQEETNGLSDDVPNPPGMRCSYYEVVKRYVGEPEFIFEAIGRIDLQVAKRIARHWYAQHPKGQYIEHIYKDKLGYGLTLSGGACSGGARAYVDSELRTVTFKQNRILVCS